MEDIINVTTTDQITCSDEHAPPPAPVSEMREITGDELTYSERLFMIPGNIA